MKIKKAFYKYLLTLLLYFNILIPTIIATSSPPSSTETAVPYSDMPNTSIRI